MTLHLDVTNKCLDELVARAREEGGGRLASKARATFMRIGAAVEAEAKPRAPVVTGTLRRSIYFRALQPIGVRVGASVGYAKFVEFGTGRRGDASGVTPFGGYSYGPIAGMAARPYLQPGLNAAMPSIRRLLRELGLGIVRRLARGGSE